MGKFDAGLNEVIWFTLVHPNDLGYRHVLYTKNVVYVKRSALKGKGRVWLEIV